MRVKTPDGKIAEFPDDTEPTKIEAALRAQFPPTSTTVKHAPVSESALGIFGGALKDIIAKGRPEADVLGRAVFQPKNVGEAAVREAIMAPVSAVSMPMRILASGASGAVDAFSRGQTDAGHLGWATFLDAAAAAGTEAVMGKVLHGLTVPMIGKIPGAATLAEPLTRAKEGFKYYTGQLEHALDLVKDRLPKGKWLDVPAIAKGARLSVDEAIEGLKKLSGDQYKLALSQMAHKLNEAERTLVKSQTKNIPKPYAGSVLKQQAPGERFSYPGTGFQRVAETVATGLERPGRGLADIAATTPLSTESEHLPYAALPAARVLSSFGHLARRVRHTVPEE